MGDKERLKGEMVKSVMVSGLRQEDAMIRHFVHKAMFLGNPPGPDSAPKIPEWLGLSYPDEGIPPDCLYEIKNLTSGLMIRGNPVTQILQEVTIDNDLQFLPTHPFPIQRATAAGRALCFHLRRLHRDEGRLGACGHWQANASDVRFPASPPTRPVAVGRLILFHVER
jgi:hypothetical protein